MTPPTQGLPRELCPGDRHGTWNAIRFHGCLCNDALLHRRKVMSDYHKRRYLNGGQPLRVPMHGAIRRRQALAHMGWTEEELGKRMGSPTPRVGRVREGITRVDLASHQWWVAAFEKFAFTRGPSNRAHSMAVTRGWAPPLAWEDIDDPDEVPQTAAWLLEQGRKQRWAQLRKTRTQRRRRLLAAGITPPKHGGKYVPTVTAYRRNLEKKKADNRAKRAMTRAEESVA